MQLLAKIFGSPSRLKTLRLFIYNQDTAYAADEVAERAKITKEIARKEIAELVQAGLLKRRGNGSASKYQVNPRFEHLGPLGTFIRDTTNIRPQQMIAALRRVGTLRLIALSGLFMNVIESQIDLLVVGDALDERTLLNVVRTLEAELGREVRYASFSTADFRYRYGVYDRLLRDVFDYPHRLLIDKIGI